MTSIVYGTGSASIEEEGSSATTVTIQWNNHIVPGASINRWLRGETLRFGDVVRHPPERRPLIVLGPDAVWEGAWIVVDVDGGLRAIHQGNLTLEPE